MRKWRYSAAIGQLYVRASVDQSFQRRLMAWPAVAEDHGFDSGCPAEIVDMIERRLGRDQHLYHLVVAEVSGGD